MGVDESWWALWSSKPVRGVRSFLGEFDSHILPPYKIRATEALFYLNNSTKTCPIVYIYHIVKYYDGG